MIDYHAVQCNFTWFRDIMGYTFSLCPEVSKAMVLKYQWACSSPAVLGKSADSLVSSPTPTRTILIDGSGMRPRNLNLKNQPRRFCCSGSFERHGLDVGNTRGFLAEDQELTSKG